MKAKSKEDNALICFIFIIIILFGATLRALRLKIFWFQCVLSLEKWAFWIMDNGYCDLSQIMDSKHQEGWHQKGKCGKELLHIIT